MKRLILPGFMSFALFSAIAYGADTITKESPNEIKISKTVEQVISKAQLDHVKTSLEDQKAKLQAAIDQIDAYLSEAKKLGVS